MNIPLASSVSYRAAKETSTQPSQKREREREGEGATGDGKIVSKRRVNFLFLFSEAITEERCNRMTDRSYYYHRTFRTFRDGNSITVSRVFHGYRARSSLSPLHR